MVSSKIHTRLPHLISTLGDDQFVHTLLDYLNLLCAIDHISVFIFDHQLIPQLIDSNTRKGGTLAKQVGHIYSSKLFYLQDPNAAPMSLEQEKSGEDIILLRMKAADIPDPEYKSTIYDQFKLIDRVSFRTHFHQHWFVINLYRDITSGEFSDVDLKALQSESELVAALFRKHFTLLPSSVWKAPSLPDPEMLQHLILSLDSHLSQREVEVCSYALLGTTSEGIALTLGIQPNTVATLRKRAFVKLGISSMNQLYGLCLGQVISGQ